MELAPSVKQNVEKYHSQTRIKLKSLKWESFKLNIRFFSRKINLDSLIWVIGTIELKFKMKFVQGGPWKVGIVEKKRV